MGWRSVVITQPAYLSLADHALRIRQGDQQAQVPLEDISVILLDNPQITLTGQLLSACAEAGALLLTVDASHHPNGLYLPFVPHSRALQVMRAQLALKQPVRKRLHQQLIRQKLLNHAAVLQTAGELEVAALLKSWSGRVRSGDPDNLEAQAAQRYFPALYGRGFLRSQEVWINSALNYGYAILRAALARALVCHGFLPAFGVFHRSEQNAFNLADDLIEPFRALVDAEVLAMCPVELDGLTPSHKQALVRLLHKDISTTQHAGGRSTVLAAVDACVMSLGRIVLAGSAADTLVMARMPSS